MTSPPLDPHPVYRRRLSNESEPHLGGPLTYGFSRSKVLFRREGKPQRLPVHQNGTPPAADTGLATILDAYALSAAAIDGARTVHPEHLQRVLDELRP